MTIDVDDHVNPTRQGVSIVIPAYNEEHGIRAVLDSLFTRIAQLDFQGPWEVIVVNDGSLDGTACEVAAFAEVVMDYWDDEKEAEDRLILISHDQNCGNGEKNNQKAGELDRRQKGGLRIGGHAFSYQ